jgi:hypothetical protein
VKKQLKTKPQQPKPLILSTEKVRELRDDQLEEVVGGLVEQCAKSYGCGCW